MSEQKKSNQVAVSEKTPFEKASELLSEVQTKNYCTGVFWGAAISLLGGSLAASFVYPEVAAKIILVCLMPIVGFATAGVLYAMKATRQSKELKQIMKQQFKNG